MIPFPTDPSADTNAANAYSPGPHATPGATPAGVDDAARPLPPHPNRSATPRGESPPCLPRRADAAEVQRLRARLLDLILDRQAHRRAARQQGLPQPGPG